MKKISIITAFNSDCFLALMFKKSYEKYWKDEIDQLVICCHGENKEINDYIASIFEKDDKCIVKKAEEKYTELGQALDYIYPEVTGDVLVTLDSDCYIQEKGIITKYALLIGRYDVIGTKGMGCKPIELRNLIANKNHGMVRFNTALSFWDKKKLDTIENLTFKRQILRKGDKIPEIDFKLNERKLMIDTMALVTIKYLAKYKNWSIILKDENYKHVGGLSSTCKRFLRDGDKKDISVYGNKTEPRWLDKLMGKERLAWYLFIYLETVDQCKLEDFNQKYILALYNKIKISGYTESDIMQEVNNIKNNFWT